MSAQIHPSVTKNLRTIAKLDRKHFEKRSLSERFSEMIADFCGSITFVAVHAIVFFGWIVINLGMLSGVIKPFDPYPFMALNLFVSLEAIFLSTFVLIKQNRMSYRAEQWSHLDLQVNLLAEQEATRTLQLVELVCQRLNIPMPGGGDASGLAKPTPIEELMTEINKIVETKS